MRSLSHLEEARLTKRRHTRPKVFRIRYRTGTGLRGHVRSKLIISSNGKQPRKLPTQGRVLRVTKVSLAEQHHFGEYNLRAGQLMKEFRKGGDGHRPEPGTVVEITV